MAPVGAQAVGTTSVVCVSPSHYAPASVGVELALDGAEFSGDGLTFSYAPESDLPAAAEQADAESLLLEFAVTPAQAAVEAAGANFFVAPIVTSMRPTVGLVEGGVVVAVQTSNYTWPASAHARVGSVAPVAVAPLGSGALQFITPAHAPGRAATEVSAAEPVYSASGFAFTFYTPAPPPPDDAPAGAGAPASHRGVAEDASAAQLEAVAAVQASNLTVLSIAPSTGPAAGGTPVSVLTVGAPPPALSCAFGAVVVTGRTALGLECVSPAHLAGPVVVRVGEVDLHFSPTAAAFTYLAPAAGSGGGDEEEGAALIEKAAPLAQPAAEPGLLTLATLAPAAGAAAGGESVKIGRAHV